MGKLPLQEELFKIDVNLQVSCIKKHEYDDGVILRVFNASNLDIMNAEIKASDKFTSCSLVDLEELPIEKININDGMITLSMPHHKIVTLLFQ